MAVLNDNKAIVAFKNLLNKSHTDSLKELGNEAEGIFLNVPGSAVFTDEINSTPATAISEGIAIAVTADMVADGTSNGHAFFAEWPSTAPSGTDPTTSSPYAYGAGLLLNISSGDRVRNGIAPAFGNGYEAKPYDGANLIPPGDARDWVYQYNSGVFWQQDNTESGLGNPTTIQLYVYTGTTAAGASGENDGIKYHLVSGDNINVPVNHQYLIYGDLTIDAGATLTNDGKVTILNGALINNGVFNNNNILELVTLATGSTVQKYVATIVGDNIETIFTLNHILNSKDLIVSIHNQDDEDVTSNIAIILTTVNDIELIFNDAPTNLESFRVKILKI